MAFEYRRAETEKSERVLKKAILAHLKALSLHISEKPE
jgi:hypothetical protein